MVPWELKSHKGWLPTTSSCLSAAKKVSVVWYMFGTCLVQICKWNVAFSIYMDEQLDSNQYIDVSRKHNHLPFAEYMASERLQPLATLVPSDVAPEDSCWLWGNWDSGSCPVRNDPQNLVLEANVRPNLGLCIIICLNFCRCLELWDWFWNAAGTSRVQEKTDYCRTEQHRSTHLVLQRFTRVSHPTSTHSTVLHHQNWMTLKGYQGESEKQNRIINKVMINKVIASYSIQRLGMI